MYINPLQIVRQIDRQIDRQKDRWKDRWKDRQKDRKNVINCAIQYLLQKEKWIERQI